MSLLDPTSLQNTVDAVNDHFLTGKTIAPDAALETARWIAARQGLKGSYRGMAAPTERDFAQGIRLFTGERLVSASARHIMGEEAARAAWLLGRQDSAVSAAYQTAVKWMHGVSATNADGTFCCGKCTPAFWRHFWAGDFENQAAFVAKGLQALKGQRIGDGQWRRYPFFYTVYTLVDIELEEAREELRYARPVMEKHLKSGRAGAFWQRRRMIMERALEKIN
jgi:hypothetical protein